MGTRDEATVALAAVDDACRGLLRRAGQLDLQGKRDLAMRLRELAARIGQANLAARRAAGDRTDRAALARGASKVAEQVRGVAELAAELLGEVPPESIAAGTAAIALACRHAAEVAASGFAAPALEEPLEALDRERAFFLDQMRYFNAIA
jgi:hypothetical protein